MNVPFTDEQVKILIENESFRQELVKAISNKITESYTSQYSLLMERIKNEITNSLIRKELKTNFALAEHIDRKVDKVLADFVSSSIGKVVLKSMREVQDD